MAEFTSVTPVPYEELLDTVPNYQTSQEHPSTAHTDQRGSGPVAGASAGDEEELEAEEVAASKVDYLQVHVPVSLINSTVNLLYLLARIPRLLS